MSIARSSMLKNWWNRSTDFCLWRQIFAEIFFSFRLQSISQFITHKAAQ